MVPSLDKILFFDIETAPVVERATDLSLELQDRWAEKYATLQRSSPAKYTTDPVTDWQQAGIYAEFGRIVCISVGLCVYYPSEDEYHLRTKSFYGTDERSILSGFFSLLARFMVTPYHNLCGHNSKEFDIPYICRRALINGVQLPDCLQIAGKKPWEVPFLDTMALWRFGDNKSFTSLKLLTALFGIPTPKDDIDGSEVANVYYHEHNVERISLYCEKDVVATAQVYLRLNGLPLIRKENITHSSL